MKGILQIVGAALLACTLVSCASDQGGGNGGGGLINGVLGTAGRLFQAVTRTAGMASTSDKPSSIEADVGDPAAVEARGRLIETQGVYGEAPEDARKEKMASSH